MRSQGVTKVLFHPVAVRGSVRSMPLNRTRFPRLPHVAALLLCVVFGSKPVHLQAQVATQTVDGLELPTKGGLYAMDKTGSRSDLVRLRPVEIKMNAHTSSNLARGMVYSGPRSTAEIPGINAGTHLHGAGLSFLVRLGDDDGDKVRERLAIIRLKQVAESRVVSTHSQNIWGGGRKRHDDVIEVEKKDVADGAWVRLTPVKPLEAGEYGIVYLPADANLLPGEVYDFDVDFDSAKPDQAAAAGAK